MGFWRAFFVFMVTNVISKLTYLKMDFFKYKLFTHVDFIWTSFFKFLLEGIIFIIIFLALNYLFEYIQKWRMSSRYYSAEKNRTKEK